MTIWTTTRRRGRTTAKRTGAITVDGPVGGWTGGMGDAAVDWIAGETDGVTVGWLAEELVDGTGHHVQVSVVRSLGFY